MHLTTGRITHTEITVFQSEVIIWLEIDGLSITVSKELERPNMIVL